MVNATQLPCGIDESILHYENLYKSAIRLKILLLQVLLLFVGILATSKAFIALDFFSIVNIKEIG